MNLLSCFLPGKVRKITLICCLGSLLFLSGWPVSAYPQDGTASTTRSFCYTGLNGFQQSLFEGFIVNHMPRGTKVKQLLTEKASLRTFTRLAEALLFRNKPGDRENAIIILQWVLQNQDRNEAGRNFGMWKTNTGKDRQDQNWREFIGCDLILIYQNYKNNLPESITGEIRKGLICAARGAMKRNVDAGYTNISVMSAFLMNWTGTTFGIEELGQAGAAKAREIYNLYNRHGTFSEYNSPTYYGVTLIGLALWRELGSGDLKPLGTRLESSLWMEIAGNYHPGMKNLTGPYFRAYGMDMTKYWSIAGLWIALALDDIKKAPLPRGKGSKEDELSNIAPILHVGLAIPPEAREKLEDFRPAGLKEVLVPCNLAGDTLRRITTWMDAEIMMGGLWGNRRNWNQVRAGTIHWKSPPAETGWLMVPGDGTTDVQVREGHMVIFSAGGQASRLTIYLFARDVSPESCRGKSWNFPGTRLNIHTSLKWDAQKVTDHEEQVRQTDLSEEYPQMIRLDFQLPANLAKGEKLIDIEYIK